MSDLRDTIADIVTDATDERHDRTVRGDYDPVNEEPYVTRILAAVADALMTPEAVNDAALAYVDAISPAEKGTHRQVDRATARYAPILESITAALRSAGITKG